MSTLSIGEKWRWVALVYLPLAVLACAKAPRVPLGHGLQSMPLHPQARGTLTTFQSALRDDAWEKALTLCSATVKVAAGTYDSPETFLRAVVPVQRIVDLRQFDTHVARFEGARRLEVTAYRWSVPVAVDAEGRPMIQRWDLTKNGDRWEITFPCEPLDVWVRGVMQRREELKDKLGEVGKAMARQAAKERGEPMPSDEFLAQKQREGRIRQEKRDEEQRQQRILRAERLAQVASKLAGVHVVLEAAKETFRRREPIPLKLELINGGDWPLYYQFIPNRSLTVLDEQDRIVAWTRGELMEAQSAHIDPGQTVVLFEDHDIAAAHAIDRPGRYRVEFNGSGLAVGDQLGSDPNAEIVYAEAEFVSKTVEIKVDR